MKKIIIPILFLILCSIFHSCINPPHTYPAPIPTYNPTPGWIEFANAGFTARSGHTSVVYNNQIWVIAGFSKMLVNSYSNDVWESYDGASWYQVNIGSGFTGRENHTSVIYNNLIWVIAGYNGSTYLNDIWDSY